MNDLAQWVFIGFLFFGAIFYLIQRIRKSSQGHACEGAACDCKPHATLKK